MFQYISDIHLEYISVIPFIKKTADNIFLIGDIGHPGTYIFDKFIKQCSFNYKNVFLIYGNHEYYSTLRGRNKKIETMQERVDYAKDFPDNVYFLNNSCVYFNKYTQIVKKELSSDDSDADYIKIIGSTLWSKSNKGANNFKNIYKESQFLTFAEQSDIFNESRQYLIDEVSSNPNIQCIVLTHYTTHMLANGLYIGNKDTNHIPELFYNRNLIAAINGHTHSSINLTVPGTTTKLLSNCYGYRNEMQQIVRYNENAILTLDDQNTVSFYGLYSTMSFSPIDILSILSNRPYKKYDIGPIDDRTSFVITQITKDYSIIYASMGFEMLTGYKMEEIVGLNCRFLQSPNGDIQKGHLRQYCDNNLLFNIKKDISNNEECQFITYNFKKSGERFINLVTIIPIQINTLNYTLGFQCDITDVISKFHVDKFNISVDSDINADTTSNQHQHYSYHSSYSKKLEEKNALIIENKIKSLIMKEPTKTQIKNQKQHQHQHQHSTQTQTQNQNVIQFNQYKF